MEYRDLPSEIDRLRGLLEDRSFEEAFALAEEIRRRAPLDSEVIELYVESALAIDEPLKALRASREHLRTEPSEPARFLELVARAQWDLGLIEECRRTCERILALEPDNYIALDYGLATVLELGDFPAAAHIIELAVSSHRDDPHLSYQTAVARMMRGEDDWARKRFEEFLEEDPGEPGTYINLMRIHHLGGRYQEVRKLFNRAGAEGIEHEDLYFNMGLALKAEGRDRKAARYFIRSARMNPGLPDAQYHLGQILRNEGHPRLALWMLERELRVDDTHPSVHAEMAWSAEDLGEYGAAVRMIKAAVERAPELAVYRHSLAELLLRADPSSEEAERAAQDAVEADPMHAAGWQILGRLAAERGELDRAERCLRKAVDAEDASIEDRGWLGLLLAGVEREVQALPYLEEAARTYPFWGSVCEALAKIRGRHRLPSRYEVRMTGEDEGGRIWYRVLHVVAGTEQDATKAALGASSGGAPDTGEVEEVRPLGAEVDHDPGVLWDSGRTGRRYPQPPEPELE